MTLLVALVALLCWAIGNLAYAQQDFAAGRLVDEDVRMRERRAERRGMRRSRERPVGKGAQALLLDPAAHAARGPGRQ